MPKVSDVGAIVGRFQVHRLHDAHRQLIAYVTTTHRKTIIILGLAHARVTTRNPLDFEARKQMLLADFPHATVLYLKDRRDDAAWSRALDELLGEVLAPAQTVTLYGGRDSFITHYTGKHMTEVLEPDRYLSGTELRKDIARGGAKASEDFRAGAVWAASAGFPRVFPTVDVAIWRSPLARADAEREWLLVRKANETGWRFCGGFVEPRDESFESAARREVGEETGVALGELQYVTSLQVDDWRYRQEDDKITTVFYAAPYQFGPVMPADDIVEARWFPNLSAATIVEEHRPLVTALQQKGGLVS
jgi:bifunctional NMN adenylyltransferase/nudix hydrolase